MAETKHVKAGDAIPADKNRVAVTSSDIVDHNLMKLFDANATLVYVEVVNSGITEFQVWQEVDKL